MTLCINCNTQNPNNNLFCQKCGSELLLEGRYRVIGLIGQGGFGITYEVNDQGITKILKVLRKDSTKAVELFQREARFLANNNCPGIPQAESNCYFTFHPRDSQQSLHCLIMEKIEGENLSNYIKQLGKPIKGGLGLRWLRELAEILDIIHNQDIIHRDIKPSNIMLKPDGNLVLIDFGVMTDEGMIGEGTETATATSGTQTATHTAGSTRIYSKNYTAPEQIEGQAIKQSDIYSLGRTFVYLLTAKEPNDPMMYDAYNDRVNWRQYAQEVSPQFADLIDSMIQRVPNQRPANTQEILQQLQELQQTEEITNVIESIDRVIETTIAYFNRHDCNLEHILEMGRDIGKKLTRETEVLLIEKILAKIEEISSYFAELRYYWSFIETMNSLHLYFADLLIGVWNIGRKGPIDNNNVWKFVNSAYRYDYYDNLGRFLGVMKDYGINYNSYSPELDITLPLYLTIEEIEKGVDKNVEMCLLPVPPKTVRVGQRICVRGQGKLDSVTQHRGDLYYEVKEDITHMIWREYHLLVAHRLAIFPARCLKTNKYTNSRLNISFNKPKSFFAGTWLAGNETKSPKFEFELGISQYYLKNNKNRANLKAKSFDEDFIWIEGVCDDYLSLLPEWHSVYKQQYYN